MSPTSWRENARENDKEILELCAREDYPVIIGSDAHADHNVGANSYALDLMEEIHFPEHLILNYQIDEVGISTAMGGRGFYEKESCFYLRT